LAIVIRLLSRPLRGSPWPPSILSFFFRSLDSSLDARRFVRIHRSAIVNIDVIDELRQDAHGDYIVRLRDRTEVRVGRRFRARLQARLGQPL
jgi:two-component system LytT family response regulator